MRTMTRYPLLFGFRDLVAGNGYVANVSISNGRALLVDEEDGFWMYGVTPGGLAAGGKSIGDAQSEFRTAFKSILFDIAEEAQSFEAFRTEVERFLRETNNPTLLEWGEAVAEVRLGHIGADWLPRKSAESTMDVEIIQLENPMPSVNALDEEAKIAA
jgi:hypothetical protein